MAEAQAPGVQGVAYRCQRCGAPLEVTPDTIVAVCPYCGFPNWTSQAYMHPIVLVPAQSRRAPEFFKRYMETDPDMRKLASKVRLKRMEVVYAPFYYSDVETRGNYYGVANVVMTRVRVVRTSKGTTTRVETTTVTVTVRGSYEMTHLIDVVARRSVDSTIVDALSAYYLQSKPNPVPIAEVNWEDVKGAVLAPEIAPQEAASIARDEACDYSREKVEEEMASKARREAMARRPGWTPSKVTWISKKIACRAVNKTLSPITLLPYIEYVYTYAGASYRLALAGWDGGKLVAEEPVTTGQRIAYAAGAVASAGLLGGAGLAAASLGTDAGIAGGILAFIVGAAANYYLAKKAVADVRVERGVEAGKSGGGLLSGITKSLL